MTKTFNPAPVSQEQFDENTHVMESMGGSNFGSYDEYVQAVRQRNTDMVGRGADANIMGGWLNDAPAPSFQPMHCGTTADMVKNLHLAQLAPKGTASYEIPRMKESTRSRMDVFANGISSDDNDLPVGPGKTYLTHLFNHHKMKDKLQKHNESQSPKNSIYTDQQEALRTALQLIGCYSDRNQGGMPIDVHDAKQLWFGDKEVSKHEEAEFRSLIETGDNKLDPKKVRRFVNHDGSLTWEVLNDDKTVMSRFTMGEYNGKKLFAQGGYKSFAELLKKAKGKFGEDFGAQFDAIRGMGA